MELPSTRLDGRPSHSSRQHNPSLEYLAALRHNIPMPASTSAKAETTGHVAQKMFTLRCYVYRQRSTGLYVAECIDLDIMVKAKKPNKAMRELRDAILG